MILHPAKLTYKYKEQRQTNNMQELRNYSYEFFLSNMFEVNLGHQGTYKIELTNITKDMYRRVTHEPKQVFCPRFLCQDIQMTEKYVELY